MNVGELKKFLKDISDDTQIMTPIYDHQFGTADVRCATALYNSRDREYIEDYGEEITSEKEYGKRIDIIVIT